MTKWEPDADLNYAQKQAVLADYFGVYLPHAVVETGLYNGRGSSFQFIGKATVVVCDLRQDWCDKASAEGVSLAVVGDTRDTFPGVVAFLNGPALFWLDSHLVSEADEPNDSPLMAELAAILAWPHAAQSVVLIDDVRMMGRDGWPTAQQVIDACSPTWDVEIRDDIIRCVPHV